MNKSLSRIIYSILFIGISTLILLSGVVYHRVSDVDFRLTALESRIVGRCSEKLNKEHQPNCHKGWHREQMQVLLTKFCESNPDLHCPNITDDWPSS